VKDPADNRPLWTPRRSGESALEKLQERNGFESYWQTHDWSIKHPNDFWSQVWDDLKIIGDKGNTFFIPGDDFISASFFPEARLNIAENLLMRGADHEIAIISILESGVRQEITWKELREKVAATAAAMKNEGVSIGDRIAAWTPNVSETVIWSLAALSIGAIVSTASPDFAPAAVQERFGQIEPKLILVSLDYEYGGKHFNLEERVNEIKELLPTVQRVITTSAFEEFISPFNNSDLFFTRLPFNHPGFILFSSGTTGKPKCIVHSGAGVLIKAGEEILYQFAIKPGEKVLFYTTCGWMMWNWLVINLLVGATIVLYDGSPAYPIMDRLFEIADLERIEFLGASAKYFDSLRKSGVRPQEARNLSHLRMIGSTGSVLAPESFDFIYNEVKGDVHLASLSGGTDICGCFLASIPTLPVHRGELQGPCLGMAVDVFDAYGNSASSHVKGELVCTVPFPSKPLGFWGDDSNEKYRASYFEGFPGVWTHGDFVSKSETGGFVIYGRSDATLNSRGVRIGTAEIYRVVEKFSEVQEALAVAQDWDGDSRILLFLVLDKSASLDEDLEKRIKTALRVQASPRHVPDKIIAAPQFPRTKSNKLVELAVADVINGREVRNRHALANPEALDWFADHEALKN
jgi:acetoacetyl-CoA synthetase